ncbi:hypothetical protein [Haladaptatus sp. NG-SE-30]
MSPPQNHQLTALSETHPAQYSFLLAHFADVQQAFETCSRNYPSTARSTERLDTARITPPIVR